MLPKRKPQNNRIVSFLLGFGFFSTIIGLGLLVLIFFPIMLQEFRYRFIVSPMQTKPQTQQSARLDPVDTTFGIMIPKIGANAKVIPNVDPYNSAEYQQALTKGVAHAKGSGTPGKTGNTFIFSHSSVNFFEALRYNSVFYLLDKLERNDSIIVYYNGKKFTYIVQTKYIVNPTDVSYLSNETNQKLVTLMTCWPPGTTYKRMIIRAILQEQ